MVAVSVLLPLQQLKSLCVLGFMTSVCMSAFVPYMLAICCQKFIKTIFALTSAASDVVCIGRVTSVSTSVSKR